MTALRQAHELPVVVQDDDYTYVYGLDLISTTDGSSVQTYHMYDGFGSTSDLTNGDGSVTAGYGYDVFAALRSGSLGATEWLFTGEQRDSESGLYYPLPKAAECTWEQTVKAGDWVYRNAIVQPSTSFGPATGRGCSIKCWVWSWPEWAAMRFSRQGPRAVIPRPSFCIIKEYDNLNLRTHWSPPV